MNTSRPISVKVVELSLRLVIGASVYILCFWKFDSIPDDRLRGAAGTVASASGTLLGFIIAALSITAASSNGKLISNMGKVGSYDRLIVEAIATCVLLLASTVLGVVCQFLEGAYLVSFMDSMVFLTVLGLLYVFDAGVRFKRILRYL